MIRRFFNMNLNDESEQVNKPSSEQPSETDANPTIETPYGSMFAHTQHPQMTKLIVQKNDAEFTKQFNNLTIKKN